MKSVKCELKYEHTKHTGNSNIYRFYVLLVLKLVGFPCMFMYTVSYF